MTWNPAADGQPNATGFDVIMTPELMQPSWAQYQVAPPLTRVWDGDDAANPTKTVQLKFTDEATARTVLATLWSADAPV